MMFTLLLATAVHWVAVPNTESPEVYVGWKLDQQQVLALDRRLQLPEGAYPREQYVRYYSGHIAPDGKKALFVTLEHKRLIPTHPKAPVRKPDHIYIEYRAKGRAPMHVGFHMGCLFIGGEFDAEFKPIKPLACANKGI